MAQKCLTTFSWEVKSISSPLGSGQDCECFRQQSMAELMIAFIQGKVRKGQAFSFFASSGMITLLESFFLELSHHAENTRPYTLLCESHLPRGRHVRDEFIWKLKPLSSAYPAPKLLRHLQLFKSISAIEYPHLKLQTICKRDRSSLLCYVQILDQQNFLD